MSNTTKQITVRIVADDCQGDMGPREWGNLGTMVCWHRRYNLGDEQPKCDPTEYQDDLPKGTIQLPLHLYDHSGITMSTSGFSCPWDSGQVGFIYVTPERIIEEYGDDSDESRAKATSVLEGEVKVYDCHIRGDVWGYQVMESEVCGCCDTAGEADEIDGCWGFYDMDGEGCSALDGIREHVDEKYHHLLAQAWEDRSFG
jgi:hypothetical protein